MYFQTVGHLSFDHRPQTCPGKHVDTLEIDIHPAGEITYVRTSFTHGGDELSVTVMPA